MFVKKRNKSCVEWHKVIVKLGYYVCEKNEKNRAAAPAKVVAYPPPLPGASVKFFRSPVRTSPSPSVPSPNIPKPPPVKVALPPNVVGTEDTVCPPGYNRSVHLLLSGSNLMH